MASADSMPASQDPPPAQGSLHALSLSFEGADVEKIIDEDGLEWMTLEDAGRCVGYSKPGVAVAKVIRRNPADFEGRSRETILVSRDGKPRKHLLLNREGLMALGFLARTDRAVRFRTWLCEFFMSPTGGMAQLMKTIQDQQRAIESLQKIAVQAVDAAGAMASINARALAFHRWHRLDDPRQIRLPYREIRELTDEQGRG